MSRSPILILPPTSEEVRTPPSLALELSDVPLPPVVFDAQVGPAVAKRYKRITDALAPIQAARAKAKESLKTLIPGLLKKFDAGLFDDLRAAKVALLTSLQDEVDLIDQFTAFLVDLIAALQGLRDDAARRLSEVHAAVVTKIMDIGFDAESADAVAHSAITMLHPSVRAIQAVVAHFDGQLQPLLDPGMTGQLPDGTTGFVSPFTVEGRRNDLMAAIQAEVKMMLASAGNDAAVLFAYRNGGECAALVNPADR